MRRWYHKNSTHSENIETGEEGLLKIYGKTFLNYIFFNTIYIQSFFHYTYFHLDFFFPTLLSQILSRDKCFSIFPFFVLHYVTLQELVRCVFLSEFEISDFFSFFCGVRKLRMVIFIVLNRLRTGDAFSRLGIPKHWAFERIDFGRLLFSSRLDHESPF